MKFERIVVGIDFTAAGLAAIQHAVGLAQGSAQVALVHAIGPDLLPRAPLFDHAVVERMFEGLEADARQTLGQLERELRSNGTRVTTEIRTGRPADELLAAAKGADLLVVGAHARGLMDRIALGSVAEEIVRRSSVPVLVVRERAEGSTRIPRVLVAVDLDDPFLEAIDAAVSLAGRAGAKLEAIHVVPWPVPAVARFTRGMPEDLEGRVREDAARSVRSLLSTVSAQHATVKIAFGAPAAAIAAQAQPDDVIVTGTHGRGTVGRLAFGSVATKLLRTAPCPVLVVRPTPGTPPLGS